MSPSSYDLIFLFHLKAKFSRLLSILTVSDSSSPFHSLIHTNQNFPSPLHGNHFCHGEWNFLSSTQVLSYLSSFYKSVEQHFTEMTISLFWKYLLHLAFKLHSPGFPPASWMLRLNLPFCLLLHFLSLYIAVPQGSSLRPLLSFIFSISLKWIHPVLWLWTSFICW